MSGRIRTKNAGQPQYCWAAISFTLLAAVCLTASAQEQPEGPGADSFREADGADGDKRSKLEAAARQIEEQKRQLEVQQKSFHEQQKASQMRAAQMQAMMQQQGFRPPLPEDAEVKIFHLRYSKATALIDVLDDILGDRGLRMGADDLSNSLIVSADKDSAKIVEAMLMKLDQPSDGVKSRDSIDTLQLRIVWLLDGVDGKKPTGIIDTGDQQGDVFVSPQVVDALALLGFETPKVVCQQVTTITVTKEQGAAQSQFTVPVLINGKLWELSGKGLVRTSAEDRFAVQFEVEYAPIIKSAPDVPHSGQLAGSIHTPLRHFTVMGTTTFVEPPEVNSDGGVGRQPQQHLSAFVVYLDRAQEFPANVPATK